MEAGDAIVASLAAGGVEVLFFTSGSELAFLQEAIAKAAAHAQTAPRLVLLTHEYVAINAALGYGSASGTPTATCAHVDVGTQHYGAGIHSAMRSRLPVVVIAGVAPVAAAGTRRGAREAGHFWSQEVPDQAAIVRQYMKWTGRIDLQDSPGLLTSRALQVAMSAPRGPVYLAVPREVALSRDEQPIFRTVHELGIPLRQDIPSHAAKDIAQRLHRAAKPAVIVCASGRDPASVPALQGLCEAAGMAVVDAAARGWGCFPMDHPLYQANAKLDEFDFLLVLDADVPWLPGNDKLRDGVYICVVDEDPIKLNFPTYEFVAQMRVQADSTAAIRSIHVAFSSLGPCARAAERTAEWRVRSEARAAAHRDRARPTTKNTEIDPRWLAACVGEMLGDSTILVDDTLSHNPMYEHLGRTGGAGQYFRNPGSAGGWGPGFAFGVKLARPDHDVILVTGDGFYLYGCASAALLAAARYRAPFLTVVFQNRSYSTTTKATADIYPDGYAVRAGLEGGFLEPAMDFAKEAEAAGGYGETVRDPVDLPAALQRGLAKTREGKAAVIAVWLARYKA